MSKSKKAPVDHAIATIKETTANDALKVSVTHTLAQAMQQAPDWGTATDVQAAVKVWTGDADALDANAKVIAELRAQLKAAEAKQGSLRRNWAAAKKQVVSTVTVFCGGSADKVKAFNLDVVKRTLLGALVAPGNLVVSPGKVIGEVVSKWARGLARHGFVVQHATDPTNQATISAPIPCTKVTFKLDGVPSNTNVSFRVAAINPSSPAGQSPWSAWVVGNAR